MCGDTQAQAADGDHHPCARNSSGIQTAGAEIWLLPDSIYLYTGCLLLPFPIRSLSTMADLTAVYSIGFSGLLFYVLKLWFEARGVWKRHG